MGGDPPPGGYGSPFFIEQFLSRTPDLPLLTIPAGQSSPHKGISQETQKYEGNDERNNRPGKFLYDEHNSCKNGNEEQQEIRDKIFPGQVHRAEILRVAPCKKPSAQPAFAKRTGPAVIVTVHAVPADEPELQEKNKNHIRHDPEEAEPGKDDDANDVNQNRYNI